MRFNQTSIKSKNNEHAQKTEQGFRDFIDNTQQKRVFHFQESFISDYFSIHKKPEEDDDSKKPKKEFFICNFFCKRKKPKDDDPDIFTEDDKEICNKLLRKIEEGRDRYRGKFPEIPDKVVTYVYQLLPKKVPKDRKSKKKVPKNKFIVIIYEPDVKESGYKYSIYKVLVYSNDKLKKILAASEKLPDEKPPQR